MGRIVRFGVSFEEGLLQRLDRYVEEEGYANRSEALRDLIRREFVKKEWGENCEVAAAITLVYNHHRRELMAKLTDIQHGFHDLILSSQHLHLDEHNCLEIIALKGKSRLIQQLFRRLKSVKGIRHAECAQTSTGRQL